MLPLRVWAASGGFSFPICNFRGVILNPGSPEYSPAELFKNTVTPESLNQDLQDGTGALPGNAAISPGGAAGRVQRELAMGGVQGHWVRVLPVRPSPGERLCLPASVSY